jgi:hypothetical protein
VYLRKRKKQREGHQRAAAKASAESHRCWLTAAFLMHQHNKFYLKESHSYSPRLPAERHQREGSECMSGEPSAKNNEGISGEPSLLAERCLSHGQTPLVLP